MESGLWWIRFGIVLRCHCVEPTKTLPRQAGDNGPCLEHPVRSIKVERVLMIKVHLSFNHHNIERSGPNLEKRLLLFFNFLAFLAQVLVGL